MRNVPGADHVGQESGRLSGISGIEAVLFDLDGTLIDSGADIAAAANRALAAVGRPALAESVIRGFVGDGVRNLVRRCLGGDEEELERTCEEYERAYAAGALDRTVLYPGVRELLKALGARPMAVISNKPERFCRQILEALGVAGSFGAIVGGDTFPERKPSEMPLLGALRRIGAAPESALMVGDGPQDLRAAKAARVRSCAALWGFTDRERLMAERPDFVAATPDDVRRLLNG